MPSSTPVRATEALIAVLASIAAILWFSHLLHTDNLQSSAVAVARGGSENTVRAQALLRRASDFNADPEPRVMAAQLLMREGRWAEAAAPLRSVVAHNRGNVTALTLLADAETHYDHAAAARTGAALLALYGHLAPQPGALPGVSTLPNPALTALGYEITAGPGTGYVESVGRKNGRLVVAGWALNAGTHRRVDRVVVVTGGRLLKEGIPTRWRRDVPAARGPAGFQVAIRTGVAPSAVRVYAVVGRHATPLRGLAGG